MRKINKVILHCSASDNPKHDNLETIKQWHLDRGFNDIGYHYVIDKKGNILEGRTEDRVGAHCEGQNHDSIGICLTGLEVFTTEQFSSLRWLVNKLKEKYSFGDNRIRLHNEYNPKKTCPNFTRQEAGLAE